MFSLSAAFGAVLVANLRLGHAAEFLGNDRWGSRSVSTSAIEHLLEQELPSAVKLDFFKAALQPMYKALPKNEFGRLDSATVRYALHRHFAHRYGWYVKGLTYDGSSYASNRSAEILKDRVPFHIQGLLDKRVSGRGLDLGELAIFASTLFNLIEMDALSGFEECFDALGLPRTGPVTALEVEEATRGYLARFIFGAAEQLRDSLFLHSIETEIEEMYAGWQATVMWLQDTHKTIEWSMVSERNPFVKQEQSFERASKELQLVMQRFAQVANSECPDIKSRLLSIEHDGTGRVRLIDFYATAPLKGIKPESIAYLRNLGVLDETDKKRPMLLVANYVTSKANCLVDASYYSSCCLDECETLFSQVERAIASPTAPPGRIIEIVSKLASDTIDAPRNISATMVAHLAEIALHHEGEVPLHGRLFAQWMHHAYPRECPFPQLHSGEQPLSQEEFFIKHGLDDVFATSDEISEHSKVEHAKAWEERSHISADALPWNEHEELIATDKYLASSSSSFTVSSNAVRIFVACVALGSMIAGLTRKLVAGTTTMSDTRKEVCV